MKKAFTLIELLVAIGILAMVLSFASVIFRVSINSQRTASANAEIMRKLRAITDQLNADFQGLRKDGEIFVVWVAGQAKPSDPNYDHDGYVRFDRIMFFADGDFQSYGVNHPIVRGNVARICYMLANRPGALPVRPTNQEPEKRILARTQHILTADDDPALDEFIYPGLPLSNEDWLNWNNQLEYDKISLPEWKNIPWVINADESREPNKPNMLSVITDVTVANRRLSESIRGSMVNPAEPNSIHMLLCEGVGEFKVQGWYDAESRWVPEVDPDGDRDLTDDSDFFLDGSVVHPNEVPGVLYPYPYGLVSIRDVNFPSSLLNEANFNSIPGLGRALKFTFTLYDSKGVIKDGRTFTHIVYLDN